MEISNMQAVLFCNSVNELSKKRLPIDVLFAIRYNFNLFANQVQTYEEARKSLNLGDNDEITKELGELLSESVDQPVKKIKMEDLSVIDKSSDYDKLTLAELDRLYFMIEEV